MIDISKLTDKDLGRGVVYRSLGGDEVEQGIITNWNDRYVFVRYGTIGSAATRPEDLEWVAP